MTHLSCLLAHAVLLAYDFSGVSSVVDIGGGKGELLKRLLEVYPQMRGTVFDLPHTREPASEESQQGKCGTRFSHTSGNFFEFVPKGADAYLLCNVLHDWNDQAAIRVLKNCRAAMTESSRVLLVEMIVPEGNSASFSKLLDLNMLVMTGGRERTRAEFAALFGAAGFNISRVFLTLAPQSIIEATPSAI